MPVNGPVYAQTGGGGTNGVGAPPPPIVVSSVSPVSISAANSIHQPHLITSTSPCSGVGGGGGGGGSSGVNSNSSSHFNQHSSIVSEQLKYASSVYTGYYGPSNINGCNNTNTNSNADHQHSISCSTPKGW